MIARNKRVVAGQNIADMDLAEWIDPLSYGAQSVFNKAVRKFVDLAKSDSSWFGYANTYGLENILAVFCWSTVNVEIPYRSDTEMFKRADFWLLPSETYSTFKAADCEDSTHLLASALENILLFSDINDPTQYFCCLGYYYDGSYWGHAFILWRNKYLEHQLKPTESYSNKYYVFETTWDEEISPFSWYNWRYESYIPAIIFNRRYCSTTLNADAQSTLGVSQSYIERHKEAIQNMIDYVTTGRLIKESWRHKTKERMVPMVDGLRIEPKATWLSRLIGKRKIGRLLRQLSSVSSIRLLRSRLLGRPKADYLGS
ncbi:MAG: hypothetical protein QXM54_02850 [Desulfurococcaceae archaeon]